MRSTLLVAALAAAIPSLAFATSKTIAYQGRLENDGAPATGTYAFRFALVKSMADDLNCLTLASLAANCGLWNEEQLNIPVSAGAFAVQLGSSRTFPNDLFRSGTPYLGIAVRGPGDAQFFLLAGRQRIGTTPYAIVSEVGLPPVGAIIAWHKNLGNTPALGPESDWAECNGQQINDPESPFFGRTLPNLNGEGRFLRGAPTSGTMQQDQMQDHKHFDKGHSHSVTRPPYFDNELASGGAIRGTVGYYNAYSSTTTNGFADLAEPVAQNGTALRIGGENRPTNMSVVWIIRIK